MNISGVGEMGVGETGVGETGQIIGETGVCEMGVGETGTSRINGVPATLFSYVRRMCDIYMVYRGRQI